MRAEKARSARKKNGLRFVLAFSAACFGQYAVVLLLVVAVDVEAHVVDGRREQTEERLVVDELRLDVEKKSQLHRGQAAASDGEEVVVRSHLVEREQLRRRCADPLLRRRFGLFDLALRLRVLAAADDLHRGVARERR